jgi:hypothetical protein
VSLPNCLTHAWSRFRQLPLLKAFDSERLTPLSANSSHSSSHPDRHDALRVKETAVPPADQHKHAKRDMILSEDDAKAATHDHQHLAPVVRESYQAYMLGELAADMHVLM